MTCKANLILFDDQCVENCPDGHFPSDKMCYECHPMCSRCTGRNNFDSLIKDKKNYRFCFLKVQLNMNVQRVPMVLLLMKRASNV